jgi:subtilase family serine protease
MLAIAAAAIAAAALTASSHTTAARGVMHAGVTASPKYVQLQQAAAPSGLVRFTCQLPTFTAFRCYGPDQIRAAYGVQPLLDAGVDGAGSTIVIIDAYGSPTLTGDLANFNAVWGLPAANLTVLAPYGIAPTTPANADGWSGETTLDVEWAHAIAPAAKIVLLVARSNDDSDILDVTQYMVDHSSGDVLSQSFGEAEQCMDPAQLTRQHAIFDAATAKGITLFASSGDQGAGIPTCSGTPAYFKATSTPASDPNVTSVGGTTLVADGISGAYGSESTWNESADFGDAVAGGGGVSVLFPRPDYQAPFVKDTHAREVPDVAYNAAVFHGVIVAWKGSFFLFGGTSAGSPQWAGLVALADQMAGGRIGPINKTLYKLAKMPNGSSYFRDTADGSSNSIPALGAGSGTPISGFDAVPGYDMATGLGSPIASALVPALAKPGNG